MTQLILDTAADGLSFALPESRGGKYQAWEDPLTVDLTMIPGNMVKELKGNVWKITYQYGWFNDEERAEVIAICKKGRSHPILCAFLPPDSDEIQVGEFFVTGYTPPKFMWSRITGKGAENQTLQAPLWGGFALELREVEPHD